MQEVDSMHRPITAGHTTSRLILDQLQQISRTPSESTAQSALSQQASMSSPVLERSKSAPALLTAAQRTMLAQVGACNSHLTSDENMAINELRLHKPRLPKDMNRPG
ncbi:Inosine/uridine-preferring nucleoside hydrolase, partial [Pseudomonas savastanoi pv. nerii]